MTNPTTTDWRKLCAELFEIVEDEYSGSSCLTELCNRTATALAQPEPQGPTDEELLDLFGVVTPVRYVKVYKRELDFARAVLARWSRPAIKPVPVSGRLPGPEDCDDQGRCWMCGKVDGDWRLISIDNPGVPQLKYAFSHWLPHWVLPVPQQELDND